ncbi:MAG: molecular chaperone HscC [Firmicutes bacterium]|nr:molecular chaperone HscC [Bacillota bacterium]
MLIGIDLGTTNSLAACYRDGEPVLIPNRLGGYLTPSVVSIDEEGNLFTGQVAKEKMITSPDQSASVFKRSMGTGKEFLLGNKRYSATDLSALILRSLKEDAEVFLGEEVTEAIISVPAYFNDVQRKATKQAGELAGLKVERIINEPTAAAIAYGITRDDEEKRFLVFDLGGGTFDVSILELDGDIMEVRAIAGDNYLGGEDFTGVLYNMFLKHHGLEESALTKPQAKHLWKQAELCKISFSEAAGGVSKMTASLNGDMLELDISAADYEKACGDLLERLKKPIERSLKDAKLRVADLDEIILVGGGTRLSLVRSFVTKLFRRFPNISVNPDEAVAIGAALQCAMKERNEDIKEIVLTDVCPFTLGTSVVRTFGENEKEGGYFLPIIERNTVIPVSRRETLYTVYDKQKEITVDILQGESRLAKNNLHLGEIHVRVPEAPAGGESINVTYTYDINSLLEVIVKVNSTGYTKKMIIKSEESQLSDEEAEARMKELDYLKVHPRDQEINQLILARGERIYEESTGFVREELANVLAQFEHILDRQDPEAIEKAQADVTEILDSLEGKF